MCKLINLRLERIGRLQTIGTTEGGSPLAEPLPAIGFFQRGKGTTCVVAAGIHVHPTRAPIGVHSKVHVWRMYLSWPVSAQFSELRNIFHIQRASRFFLHIHEIVERTDGQQVHLNAFP
jgi:hypothetical protein